jgi:hypothetical protein
MARGNLRIEKRLIGGVVLEILYVNPRKIHEQIDKSIQRDACRGTHPQSPDVEGIDPGCSICRRKLGISRAGSCMVWQLTHSFWK